MGKKVKKLSINFHNMYKVIDKRPKKSENYKKFNKQFKILSINFHNIHSYRK